MSMDDVDDVDDVDEWDEWDGGVGGANKMTNDEWQGLVTRNL